MVKKRTTTTPKQLYAPSTSRTILVQRRRASSSGDEHPLLSLRQPLIRYGTLALTLAVVPGAILVFAGFIPLGKGLILGALFSVVNFTMMAFALPLRIGRKRGPATLISLASITVRYALLAAPLVIAVTDSRIAVSSTSAGLFMVQLAILIDRARAGQRNLEGAEE